MNRYLSILAAAMLVACGGEKDPEEEDTSDTDDPSGCENGIESLYPGDGDTGVFYRTTVDFELEVTPEGDETITVSSDGAAVAGSTTYDGYRVVWTPNAPLSPNTTYDVTLDWECGETSVSWTTSAVGDAVEETALTDATYSLNVSSGRIIEPPGLGAIIGEYLDQEILIGVIEADSTSVSMMGALGTGSGDQDTCAPSIEFPVAAEFTENPYFEVATDLLELSVSGFDIRIDNLLISGAFSADAGAIEGAVLKGVLDVRQDVVADALDMDPDTACQTVATLGIACEPCPSDSQDYCLSVHVDSMLAELVPGTVLETITAADIADDPTCVPPAE